MTKPDEPEARPDPIEAPRKAWIEPQLDVTPIEDTSVAPFGHPEEGGTGSS